MNRLFLDSKCKLASEITLYHKAELKEIETPDNTPSTRGKIYMELML